jgi:signal transduction histidine kinase
MFPAQGQRPFLKSLFAWPRVRLVGISCTVIALLFMITWEASRLELWLQVFGIGAGLLLVFGVLERWPRRLPSWLARWALQVLAVGLAVPLLVFTAYVLRTAPSAMPFWTNGDRLGGFFAFTFLGCILAPWMALAALVRQREGWVKEQALAFELERSELARQALDARMRLLSAQVQPHFLFNTLANVQALVETGSPLAAQVLESLTAYLRAAVPRLDEASATLGQEVDLVRAYLVLMQMRMPDRLQFELQVEPASLPLRCPPLTLMTLVENAVRHGIDPSEDGGRISIRVRCMDGHCNIQVLDTGVGLQAVGRSLGTGLTALRERLLLVFGGDVLLELQAVAPHGVQVNLRFPEQR